MIWGARLSDRRVGVLDARGGGFFIYLPLGTVYKGDKGLKRVVHGVFSSLALDILIIVCLKAT